MSAVAVNPPVKFMFHGVKYTFFWRGSPGKIRTPRAKYKMFVVADTKNNPRQNADLATL